jgi:hypothetical protein
MSTSARYTDLPLQTLVLTLRARVPSQTLKPSTKPDQNGR